MRKVDEILGKPAKKKSGLSLHVRKQFGEWALEAYKHDPTRPVSYYYNLFVKRLREKYVESKQKYEFYQNGIIDT